MAVASKRLNMSALLRIAATAAYGAVCVILPFIGMVVLYALERSDPYAPPGQNIALYGFALLGVGVCLSATSLLWTLWGRSPGFVKYYTLSWSAIFISVYMTMLFFLVLSTLAHPPFGAVSPGLLASSAFAFVTASAALALFIGTIAGFLPALVVFIIVKLVRASR